MVQFYFLSIMLNIIVGVILFSSANNNDYDDDDIEETRPAKRSSKAVKEAIKNTFTHRHTTIDKDSMVFKIDYYVEANRTNLWHSFLKKNRLPDL